MATGDNTWEPIPTYLQVLQGAYDYTKLSFDRAPELNASYWQDSVYNFFKYCKFTYTDAFILFAASFFWTWFRNTISFNILKPMGKRYELTASSQKKMPESAWKLLYYSTIWFATFYIITLQGKYFFFQKPSETLKDWSFNDPIPWDIYTIYVAQGSFYIHSIYATIFLDVWRKDSPVMLTHHFVTLALIFLSFALRYHKIGSLTLLLHDICDIMLEFAKLCVYFKIQAGKEKKLAALLANVAFGMFAVTWFATRLYWFPLKALYATGAGLVASNTILQYGVLMNALLWILQILHAYWFAMIIDFLGRVFCGQIKEMDDTREYDVAKRQVELLMKENQASSNGQAKNGVQKEVSQNGATQRNISHPITTD